jgi:periplasmic divalent cation tolerance protein
MLLAWTTVGTGADAERLAAETIAANLAACVQIDGPVVSHFRWEGKHERVEEFRLCFKFLPGQLDPLEKFVLAAHPYDAPEWLVVRAARVGEKYLSWAEANSHTPPL